MLFKLGLETSKSRRAEIWTTCERQDEGDDDERKFAHYMVIAICVERRVAM